MRSSYEELAPPVALARPFACTWVSRTGDDAPATGRVLPDACIDVIWDGRRLFVAGADTRAQLTTPRAGEFHVGVRFRSGAAAPFLGVPAHAITDARVDVADLRGAAAARRIEDALAGLTPHAAAGVLASEVANWSPEEGDGGFAGAVVRAAADPAGRVTAFAGDLGVTERTLHRRCRDAFGYGAKTLQRVLRFQRFLAIAARCPDAGLAALAVESGYADQPHLTRECNELSGLAPVPLLASRDVRSVQDSTAA
jgi:AraC-like DNA-binding protein